MGKLNESCKEIAKLFHDLQVTDARYNKEILIEMFKDNHKDRPWIVEDLDFSFEVLAGYHKLGYTFRNVYWSAEMPERLYHLIDSANEINKYEDMTLKDFVTILKNFGSSNSDVEIAYWITPESCRTFISNLVNREYRLGYTNKQNMVTSYSPMLAKRYPDTFREGWYLIQEKLDGNRCISYFDFEENEWKFLARSGKELKVDFDMSWADKAYAYDGEVMTLGHAGTRDFNRTSGAINGKYTDKSALHYYVYDILAEDIPQEDRLEMLAHMDKETITYLSPNVSRLPTLAKIWINANISYNWQLDKLLDEIVDKGGEGIILRDPDGMYQHKRCNELLKYKKVQTMDLRIIDWNEGKGKYEGLIGSFVCETDDHKIRVNVSGMPDAIRCMDFNWFKDKILEVAYFDISKANGNDTLSLRFPRFKKLRFDKNETSVY